MRGGRFFNSFRQLGRQPVISTPLIRNAFELGHCVSKPIKQGCLSPPSKQNQYFLIGLSSSLKKTNLHMKSNIQAKASSSASVDVVEPKEKPCIEQTSHVSSGYWGVPWRRSNDTKSKFWNTYTPSDNPGLEDNTELNKQRIPENFSDQLARLAAMSLRYPSNLLFRERYLCRAAMLETIAGVPGMVGGIVLHCKSLRRVSHSGGWIKALMEEAENERMHLMTIMELIKPSWQERVVIFAVQGIFLNLYLLVYVVSARFAHRMTGYLWEEKIQSYTQLIRDIDEGKVENIPAPEGAIDYWRLPRDASLRDVIKLIRADELHHRDINHFAADVHMHGQVLKEAPVPILH